MHRGINFYFFLLFCCLEPNRAPVVEEVILSDSPHNIDQETTASGLNQVVITSSGTGDSTHNHKEAIVVITGESDTDLELLKSDESSSLCSNEESRLLMEVLEDDR